MNHLKDFVCCLALCLTCNVVNAVNYVKKVKNAKGIEITYQSVYKGKVRPTQLMVSIVGNQMALSKVQPATEEKTEEEKLYKTPITKEFVDYTALKSYQWAELPDESIISSATPFEFGKNLKKVGEEKFLASANSRSSGTVILIFLFSPGAGTGLTPIRSSAAQSSVASSPLSSTALRAARSRSISAACGVWAAIS